MRVNFLGVVLLLLVLLGACAKPEEEASVESSTQESTQTTESTETTSSTETTEASGPAYGPTSLSFTDQDYTNEQIGGNLYFGQPESNADIQRYVFYWGKSDSEKLAGQEAIGKIDKLSASLMAFDITTDTKIPSGASHLLAYSNNDSGDSAQGAAVAITDVSDDQAPVPGGSGLIQVQEIETYWIRFSYEYATDNLIAQAELTHRLYYSLSNNINNLADLLANGTNTGQSGRASNLQPATTYYFNALVSDKEGNKAVYQSISATTLPKPVFLYDVQVFNGNLGGRSGADALCSGIAPFWTSGSNVRAFISISVSDEIRDMPSNYGLPITSRFMGGNWVKVADNWADLLDGSLGFSLGSVGSISSGSISWHSGSASDGSLAADNCSGFSSSTGLGQVGYGATTTSSWIDNGSQFCNLAAKVLCARWE